MRDITIVEGNNELNVELVPIAPAAGYYQPGTLTLRMNGITMLMPTMMILKPMQKTGLAPKNGVLLLN